MINSDVWPCLATFHHHHHPFPGAVKAELDPKMRLCRYSLFAANLENVTCSPSSPRLKIDV